ncbi:MAG: UvrD-helicase domain-containing protein, partial [Anaerolineae bacterium]
MNPTTEQHQAITRQDRALLVEAGAGTGKTWVLVQRFLHLLDRHPDWPLGGIIAVTFTEKAAREMRNRIRRGIEQRAAEAGPDSHWQARRRSLEQLQVSTIHGLCSHILRENAIAAGIDPQFTVLDEQEADLLKREALAQTLADLAEDDDPALALLGSLRTHDLEAELESLLARRGTVIRLFAELPGPEECLARWREGVAEMRRGVWADLLRADPQLADAAKYLPDLTWTDADDKLVPAVEAAQEGLAHVAAGRFPEAMAAFAEIKRTGGKASTWGGKEAVAELKAQLGALQEANKQLARRNCHLEVGEADERAAQALQLWRRLWDRLESIYSALKAERQALDFDDLELLTERLLAQAAEDERLRAFREGIRHLMVDEFQDTNEAQWAILSALAPPEVPSPADEGRLFLVGDAKQSIYRFRQAQVSVFQRTVRQLTQGAGGAAIPLSRSFRTHEALVTALNDLFDRLLAPVGEGYADYEARPGPLVAHRPAPPDLAAPVELVLLPKKREDEADLSSEEARLFEADLIAQRLHELQRSGYPVWDKDANAYRPFRYDDAAVLFRATTDVPLYEERFRAAGLPYLTVSGRGYYDRPEIQDLVSLLAAIHNPYDDLSLAAALRSPLFSLSDETLYRLRRQTADGEPSPHRIPLVQALADPPPTDEPERVAHAAAVMGELWEMAGREDVWYLLRRALDRTGYAAVLALEDSEEGAGGRRHANLEKLLRLAYERGGEGLSQFLRHVSLLKEREAREGEAAAGAPEAGAVQLMSVHAAKGLEFPVVVVADLGRAPGRGPRTSRVMGDPAYGLVCMDRDENGDWVKPAGYAWAEWLDGRMERAESNRVFYVACTRAADLLVLSGRPGTSDSWLAQVMRAWEIAPEGPEDEALSFP